MKYCLLPILLSLPVTADTLHQPLDDKGANHVYPHPLPATRTSIVASARESGTATSFPTAATPPLPLTNYQVTFGHPRDGDTLFEHQDRVSLSAVIDPQPPHYQLQLWLDGQAVARIRNSSSLTLENLTGEQYRAFFTLLDKNGKLLAKSSTITFYLHRVQVDQPSQAAP